MNCEESQNLMSAYLDEELDPSAAAGYAAHLASCEACSKSYERLIALRATVKSNAEYYAAPEALRTRILSDLAAADRPRRKTSGIFGAFGTFSAWPWARINFGVASLSSLAFAVTLAMYLQAPSETDLLNQEIVSTHFRSLQADHLADVASSDQHTVKPWFSGKLDYSPPVYDLVQYGFPLIVGRLDYLNQRSVAGLVYRHGKHMVNLFVWPDASGRNSFEKMTELHGFQLLRWSYAGMTYTAVSDMDPHELLRFQQLQVAQAEKETKLP
jgi:anti-sigma factor (TIGR02949 family)